MDNERETDALTLGIASVGDLLLKNQDEKSSSAESDSVQPIKQVNLKIPEYQRPYKWTDVNALQLLDDIIEAHNEGRSVYRVGTLILCPNEEDGSYEIVDGQQRTVTFTLLLKAMGESLVDSLQAIPDNPDTRRNVRRNYYAIKRRVDGMESGSRRDLLEFVESQCEFVVTITEHLSEAFQLFDSQNARGKTLYPHDLLKAYHLREMRELDVAETEAIVETWEDLDQGLLAQFFADDLYCIKRWMRGEKAGAFTEHEIDVFKGIGARNSYPFAQFFKGAYAYADAFNRSPAPFVTGMRSLRPFQLDTPIIAGKPFFEFAAYYYAILADIRDNDKYQGYFINDNDIVKTLEKYFDSRKGDLIARHLFDTAVLLYVDRFCPDRPEPSDLELFDRFVNQAFVWAYSLRAQYQSLGWASAQNYIMGQSGKKNGFNIYKAIIETDDPRFLLSSLSKKMQKISYDKDVKDNSAKQVFSKPDSSGNGDETNSNKGEPCKHYLHHFEKLEYLEGRPQNER